MRQRLRPQQQAQGAAAKRAGTHHLRPETHTGCQLCVGSHQSECSATYQIRMVLWTTAQMIRLEGKKGDSRYDDSQRRFTIRMGSQNTCFDAHVLILFQKAGHEHKQPPAGAGRAGRLGPALGRGGRLGPPPPLFPPPLPRPLPRPLGPAAGAAPRAGGRAGREGIALPAGRTDGAPPLLPRSLAAAGVAAGLSCLAITRL